MTLYPKCVSVINKCKIPVPFKDKGTALPVSFVCLNTGLLARSQHASGTSCDWPNQSRLPVVLFQPRTNETHTPRCTTYLIRTPLNPNFKNFFQNAAVPPKLPRNAAFRNAKFSPNIHSLFTLIPAYLCKKGRTGCAWEPLER